MTQTRPRRRPLTHQEKLALQERKQRRREKMEESRELAKGPIDLTFCLLVMLLTAIGLVILLSASFPSAYYEEKPSHHNPLYYFERQAVFAILGTAVMLLVSKFNYQRLRGAGRALIYVSVIFLILVIIPHNPIAVTAKGATRWLKIGVQFQPSEIAKVAIITYFADSISRKKDKMRSFRYGVLPYAFILVVVAGLVAVEPHLSGAILILGAGAAMMLVGGINWVWVGTAAGAAVGMVYVALFVIGYNKPRVIYWLDPWADAADKGYQLSQSLITIGSGGLWGLGLGKSRQKFLFLPEEHNDFIFAIVGEDFGLLGCLIVVALFVALMLRGMRIAVRCPDKFGTLLAAGITSSISVQAFLNMGVVVGILPTTGLPLPFFSAGGTSISITMAAIGILLNISRESAI